MKGTDVVKKVSQCDFFRDSEIQVNSIYKDDPLEKCFLVIDNTRKMKFKVRVPMAEYPTHVNTEYKALNCLNNSGLTWIPKVYYSSDSRENEILISQFYAGESIDKLEGTLKAEELDRIQAKVSGYLLELHMISSESTEYGDFAGNTYATWGAFINFKFGNHLKNARVLNVISAEEQAIVENKLEDAQSYFINVPNSFLHFDVKPANIVYDRETNDVHLIDFELSRFGDPNMEYARLLTAYGPPSKLYESLFKPIARYCLGHSYDKFLGSAEFALYELYSHLAYYTTSYIKHGSERKYLIPYIKENLERLSNVKGMEN